MSQVSIIDIEGNNPQIPTLFEADVGFAIPIANTLEILGDTVAAGIVPVFTSGSGNTITTLVQFSQAIGATDATRVGLAAFDSTDFTVDANGFVTFNGSVNLQFDADSGFALPDGLDIVNLFGGAGIQTSAAGNTVTISTSSNVALQYDTDSGSAFPSGNVFNIFGSEDITTSGAGNTVTVTQILNYKLSFMFGGM